MAMLNVKINRERCKDCELCIDACPIPCYKVDRKTHKIVVVNLKECLVCKNCEQTCPNKAITVELTDRNYSDSTWWRRARKRWCYSSHNWRNSNQCQSCCSCRTLTQLLTGVMWGSPSALIMTSSLIGTWQKGSTPKATDTTYPPIAVI